jgi:hypothetical protein
MKTLTSEELATMSQEQVAAYYTAQAQALAAASQSAPAASPASTSASTSAKTSLLSALPTASTTTSDNTPDAVESVDIILSSLSAPIAGKYGAFRQFTTNGTTYNVDDSRVQNVQVFRPNCKATLTIRQYKNKEGQLKTIIAGLAIHLPEASGLFIMR